MADVYDRIEARQFFDFNASDDLEDPDVFFDARETPRHGNNLKKYSRMSMSTGDLKHLEAALNLGIITSNEQPLNETGYASSRSCDVKVKNEKSKQKMKERINQLSKPKKFTSSENLTQGEYVPMAEAVRKFQNMTPERFHLKSNQFAQQPAIKMELTNAKTPYLRTKGRTRSVTEALTYSEKEWIEFQEQQKFKIKAHPLNKKVLQGPVKPTKAMEKKFTLIEPFKLTEVHHKVVDEPKINNEFHAKPVPKGVHEPHVMKVDKIPATIPKTPSFMKNVKVVARLSKERDQKEPATTTVLPRKTTVIPFSFEVRNQMLKKRKEDAIRRVLEEEKKAREFHAKPIPKAVLQASKNVSNNSSNCNTSFKRRENSENFEPVQFKARPATILQKKPFIPARSEKPLTEIIAPKLNSDLRAEERYEFDQQMKEKEKELARMKEEEQLKIQEEDEEEAKRLRKLADYKANPIRKYKEVHIKPSGKVTTPISPPIGKKHSSLH